MNAKHKLLEALKFFGFYEKDMYNDDIFNIIELRQRYHFLALYCHPDRKGGNKYKWEVLSLYYTILKPLALKSNQQRKHIISNFAKSRFVKKKIIRHLRKNGSNIN